MSIVDLELLVRHAIAMHIACGRKPTISGVSTMISIANGGKSRRRAEIRAVIERERFGEISGTIRERFLSTPGTIRANFGNDSGTLGDSISLDDRGRADLKGLGLSGVWSSGTAVPSPHTQHEPQLALEGLGKTEKRRRRRVADPSPIQLQAWQIRDSIAALVAPHLRAMTITAWRQSAGSIALDMARAGVTPESAAEAWRDEYERSGVPLIRLAKLQERMSIASAGSGHPGGAFDESEIGNGHTPWPDEADNLPDFTLSTEAIEAMSR